MASCARKPKCEGFAFFDSKCYLEIGVQEALPEVACRKSASLCPGGIDLEFNMSVKDIAHFKRSLKSPPHQ